MKKKIITISIIFIILVIVAISFIMSFIKDQEIKEKRKELHQFIISHLEDKYKEDFEIKNYSVEKVPLDITVVSDEEIENSNFYLFKVSSTRLVEFDVVYIEYLDNNEYLNYRDNDILEPGIYDNYIYEYKTREIGSEIRDGLSSIINNVKDIDISMTDIGNYYINNLLIRQSLDSKEEMVLYNKYYSFNKTVSNKDFYDITIEITNGDLIIDIEVNDYIISDNLPDFKNKVKKIVSYIEDKGYKNFDINLIFNKYQSAKITRYLEDDVDQIYLIFDYDMYSNELDDNKLGAYILDK